MMEPPSYLDDGEWRSARAKPTAGTSVSFVSAPSTRFQGVKQWREPKPLPDGLLLVPGFEPEYLPTAIRAWAADIAERMQCPLDFVGAPALVALGAAVGRRVCVRPQQATDWVEASNLWGVIVGRPGAMKSPAMTEALRPLNRIETRARESGQEAAREFELAKELHQLKLADARDKARKQLRDGGAASLDIGPAPPPPARSRLIINDTSYEALGEILAENPNGVLAVRDELVSLLRSLDREEFAAARGFFLSAWNGTSGYTFDRVVRGVTHIEAACVSMIGTTQPGRLADYIRRASKESDDGMVQRFGVLSWPDASPDWKNVDRWPDSDARERAWATFERLASLDPDNVCAQCDSFGGLRFLRFGPAAQVAFDEWRGSLEKRLRCGDLGPALESHLAKYRKLVPSLALINHLADDGAGPIGEASLLRALAAAEYFEAHARRAYSAALNAEAPAAKAILARVRKGELQNGFRARDIYRNAWSGLSDRDIVKAALEMLEDADWIAGRVEKTQGRDRVSYLINPRALQ
jgi:putative DNA primase/helicase